MEKTIKTNTLQILIILVFSMLTVGQLAAQQDPMYNQYLFNAHTINPAEAGARNYGTVSMLYRWQWVGIDGAPDTGSIGVETQAGNGWGLGVNVINDRIGAATNQTMNLAVSYHLNLTERTRLAAGLNGVLNNQRISMSKLRTLIDQNDPALTSNVSSFNPNAGAGLLIYNDRSFFGVSVPRLVEYKLTSKNLISVDQLRHLFVYAGKNFPLGTHVNFKPSVLARVVSSAPLSVDVNAVVNFYNFLDLGVNWRKGDGVGALAGLTLNERLMVTYAYEMPLTEIRYATLQTHEIMIRYRFGQQNFNKIDSPRFF